MLSFLNGEKMSCAYPVIKETLPKSALGYNTNNKYPQFPPLMADGRAVVASYQPEAVINNSILKETGIQTNWQYRNYLTHNAHDIMQYNFKEACNDSGYYKRYVDLPQRPLVGTPYLYTSSVDRRPVMGFQNK
jgi:hypothetical protein